MSAGHWDVDWHGLAVVTTAIIVATEYYDTQTDVLLHAELYPCLGEPCSSLILLAVHLSQHLLILIFYTLSLS